MKRMLILFVLLTCMINAQGYLRLITETQTDAKKVALSGSIDSLNTYITDPFAITSFKSDTSLIVGYSKILTSAGIPRVTVYLQADMGDNNWFTFDSLTYKDSVKTYNRAEKTIYTIAPSYRFYIVGHATAGTSPIYKANRRDTRISLVLYAVNRRYR